MLFAVESPLAAGWKMNQRMGREQSGDHCRSPKSQVTDADSRTGSGSKVARKGMSLRCL